MSNYIQTTIFTPKDSLPTTDPNKTIFGAAYDVEFGNISTAIASKVDTASNASLLSLTVTGSTVPANGIYLPSANTLGLSAGSTQIVTLATGGTVYGGATGGAKGTGTVNATGLYVNGVAVSLTTSGANPTALVGLAAVNGSATTWMRSDASPPIDQTIAPTWTGVHTWSVGGKAIQITGSGSFIRVQDTGAAGSIIELKATNLKAIVNTNWTTTATPLSLQINGTEYLGIGTSGNVTISAPTSGTALAITGAGATALTIAPAANQYAIGVSATAGNVAYIGLAGNGNTVGTTEFLISQDSSGNARLFNRANTQLDIATNSLSRIIVSAAGNVTINTPASSTALTVNGLDSVIASFTDGTRIAQIQQDAANVYFGSFSNHPFQIVSNSASRIAVNTSGNVTVNAPTSGNSLAVSALNGAGVGITAADLPALTLTANSAVTLSLRAYNGGSVGLIGTTTNHGLNLRTNDIDRLTITTAGNVTINAPSSGVPLTVNATSGTTGFGLYTGSFNAAVTLDLTNSSTGTSATSYLRALNSADAAVYGISSTLNVTAFFTNGPTAEHVFLGTAANIPLSIGTNGTERIRIFADGGVEVGAPTGGDKGAGTLNATGLFVNGTAVDTAGVTGFANPSASVGLSAVNGSATTAMRSDAAPALSVSISPTWTGNHIFNPASGTPLLVKLNGTSVFSVNGTSAPTIQGYGPTAAALVDMTPDKGTFTLTLTGGTTSPTVTGTWARVGLIVTLYLPFNGTAMTSNATTFTGTGLPAAIQPATLTQTLTCWGGSDNATTNIAVFEDNGVRIAGAVTITAASGTLTFGVPNGFAINNSGWTASGTKGISNPITLTYLLN